jgi:hypothetical protein
MAFAFLVDIIQMKTVKQKQAWFFHTNNCTNLSKEFQFTWNLESIFTGEYS